MKHHVNRIATLKIAKTEEEAGVTISGLKIAFEVKKDLATAANSATIKIYNLSEATRNQIEKLDGYIELRAGTKEQEILFIGTIANVKNESSQKAQKPISHTKEGLNMITTIEALDGLKTLRDTKINLSYGAGTAWSDILKDVANATGLSYHITPHNSGLKDATLSNGEAFMGQATTVLDKITEATKLEWSVQDNKLLFIKKGESFQNTPPLISSSTGLIGSPEKQTATDNNSERAGWSITTRLLPNVIPGSKVSIESSAIPKGSEFKVMELVHKGDTHGNEWTTIMEVVHL